MHLTTIKVINTWEENIREHDGELLQHNLQITKEELCNGPFGINKVEPSSWKTLGRLLGTLEFQTLKLIT
jgi:hypothetical protein